MKSVEVRKHGIMIDFGDGVVRLDRTDEEKATVMGDVTKQVQAVRQRMGLPPRSVPGVFVHRNRDGSRQVVIGQFDGWDEDRRDAP